MGGGVAVWHDVLVWVIGSSSVVDSDQPVPLVLAPTPDVYRKRALAALDAAQRKWRIAYTSPSMEGLQAAVRAGLGVTVLSNDMVPPDLLLAGAKLGLPDLAHAEVAMYRAPGGLSRAAELLAEHIANSMEVARKPSIAPRAAD